MICWGKATIREVFPRLSTFAKVDTGVFLNMILERDLGESKSILSRRVEPRAETRKGEYRLCWKEFGENELPTKSNGKFVCDIAGKTVATSSAWEQLGGGQG